MLGGAGRAGPSTDGAGRGPERLTRALSRAGIAGPLEAEKAITGGRVTLDGRLVREPLTFVWPGQTVAIDGRTVSMTAETIALAFHKPPGAVVSAVDPERGSPTAFDLLQGALPPELRRFRWHAIGRLDRGTTGLILFTNDERLVAHGTRPETHLPKRYLARVQGAASDEQLEPLRRGVPLDDGPARPAKARVTDDGRVELVLTEGRFHQVKRMLAAVGLPVVALHRQAIGGVELDVGVGAWRRLSDEELRRGLGFDPDALPGRRPPSRTSS